MEVRRIVKILDEVYGSCRDALNDDGGLVLVAENIQDLEVIRKRYIRLDRDLYESVSLLKSKNQPYLNVLYLCNNEFGINVIMPLSIAPKVLLEELKLVTD